MIDSADCDWTPLGKEDRRARKAHECGECRRQIRIGETYEVAKGVDDYGVSTFKTCAHCVAAREWLVIICGGFLYQGVLEDLEEHWNEEDQLRGNWLAHAIAGMKRRWTRSDGTLDRVRPLPERTLDNLRALGAIT